jgi:hypothetical protein
MDDKRCGPSDVYEILHSNQCIQYKLLKKSKFTSTLAVLNTVLY